MNQKVLNDAQRKLVEDNVALCRYIANKWIGRGTYGIDQDEIIGLFHYAMCKAAYSFDSKYGVAFSTFAIRCMENEIKMAFRKMKRYSSEQLILSSVLNVDGDGNELTLENILANDDHLKYNHWIDMENLNDILKHLTPRELEIYKYRFEENKSQAEMSKIMHISQSYISRLQSKILAKINRLDHKYDYESRYIKVCGGEK